MFPKVVADDGFLTSGDVFEYVVTKYEACPFGTNRLLVLLLYLKAYLHETPYTF